MEQAFVDYMERMQVLHDEIARCVTGLSQAALDWIPAPEMNSIGVLVAHVAGAESYWVGDVAGQEPSGRDRDAEFRTKGVDAATLLQRLTDQTAHTRAVLERLSVDELADERVSPRDGRIFTVAWALSHALEHTALHTGHIQLTRQLWDAHQPTD